MWRLLRFVRYSWTLLFFTIFIGILTIFLIERIAIVASAETPAPHMLLNVPADAEVLLDSAVHPGTFQIEVSPEEWRKRHARDEHPERPLITVNNLEVNYWLSRRDGTFFHAIEKINNPFKQARGSWKIATVEREGNMAIVSAERNKEEIICMMLICFITLALISLLINTIKERWQDV